MQSMQELTYFLRYIPCWVLVRSWICSLWFRLQNNLQLFNSSVLPKILEWRNQVQHSLPSDTSSHSEAFYLWPDELIHHS